MSMTKINWYPGHMKKSVDLIKENLPLVDILLEVLDARIPLSSKNPDIGRLTAQKKRIIVLNKIDLVEKKDLVRWTDYFQSESPGCDVIGLSATKGANFQELYRAIGDIARVKRAKAAEKGLRTVPVRLMAAGIPNVGKSQLINKIAGKASAGVRNIPGFTRGKQWIKIKDGAELLDTPGVLWPRFESEQTGYHLAITGAIRDDILPVEDVAAWYLNRLIAFGLWPRLCEVYGLDPADETCHPAELIEKIALRNHILKKGGLPNTPQAALSILRDYRNLRLGKIVLDTF